MQFSSDTTWAPRLYNIKDSSRYSNLWSCRSQWRRNTLHHNQTPQKYSVNISTYCRNVSRYHFRHAKYNSTERCRKTIRVFVKRNFSITVIIYKTDIKKGRKMRPVDRLKPFRGVGRVLSLWPHKTAFVRCKKLVFMRVYRLPKSGKCQHIGVTVSPFPVPCLRSGARGA